MQRFTGDAAAAQYVHSLTPNTVNCGSASSSNLFTVGAYSAGSSPWNGTIGSILVFPNNEAVEGKAMAFMAKYFGLTLV